VADDGRAEADRPVAVQASPSVPGRCIDLSHEIVHGMTTHPGIPAPAITTFLSHADSATRYAPGTTFEIARIELVANTGTYVDTPAHRYPGGTDLSDLALERVAAVEGVLVDRRRNPEKPIGPQAFEGVDVEGRAVLVATGWDVHWGTDAYLSSNPYLTADACRLLVARRAALVGIDSLNVDAITDPSRPAHSILLAAGIPVVEHLTGLGDLPRSGWRFFAVPPRIRGMATFPVRAFAILD
jgi:kynurenine formamidase